MLPITAFSPKDSRVLAQAGFGAIYVIGFAEDGPSAPVKVGAATDIHSRLHAIQTGNWQPLILWDALFVQQRPSAILSRREADAVYVDDMELAARLLDEHANGTVPLQAVEMALHAELDRLGLRCRGEWFSGGHENVVTLAKRAIRDKFDIEATTAKSMMRKLKMWKLEAEEMVSKPAVSYAESRSQTFIRSIVDREVIRAKAVGHTKAHRY